jgi:uncharacterized protein
MAPLRHPRSQRIDIVRGIAVFGILLINVWGFIYGHGLRFGAPESDISVVDKAVIFFCSAFGDSKARPLFAFLFGVGFSILMDRLCQEPGGIERARQTYQRRLGWLLACGFLHGVLLWSGDILTWYALIGFWLLRFAGKRTSDLQQVLRYTIMVCALIYIPVLMAGLFIDIDTVAVQNAAIHDTLRYHAFLTEGSWTEVAGVRLQGYMLNVTAGILFAPELALLFLLGAIAARRGWLTRPERFRAGWRRARLLGLLVGLPINLWYGAVSMHGATNPADAHANPLLEMVVGSFAGPLLSLAVLAHIMLMGPALTIAVGRWLAPVGRMALTNYLMQSVLCVVLLQSTGFGLGRHLSYGGVFLVCLGIMVFQLYFSRWYLKRHTMGPVETLWRRHTYR